MKKNKIMRLVSGLLVVAMITTCAISGTFAKYISQASGFDNANVAKWSFEINDTDIATGAATATMAFNLFDNSKIYEIGTTTDDADVKNATSGNAIIAPGTCGEFKLKLENTSEVTAAYKIDFTETNDNNIPLQYSLDGETWFDSIAKLEENTDCQAILSEDAIALESGTAECTIFWRWVYDAAVLSSGAHDGQTDAADTGLGVAAAKTGAQIVTIKADVTAWQVD